MSKYRPIDITQLKPGTMILIDTENNVYEIIVMGNNGEITIESGNTFFEGPTPAILMGSVSKDKEPKKRPKEIVKGMCLEFKYKPTRARKYTTIITSIINTAKIISSDKSWNYEMWEEQDENSKS
jgi:hypothetical protein